MMKRCIYISIIAFTFLNSNLFAQSFNTRNYSYVIEGQEYFVLNINIENSTNERLLLWLTNDKGSNNQDDKTKLKKYFLIKKGDFSLLDIINEYGSTIENVKTDIYYTFYKILSPNEIFSISVICDQNKKKDIDKIEREVKEQIIILSEANVKKAYAGFYDFVDLMEMSFKGNQIIFKLKDLFFQ